MTINEVGIKPLNSGNLNMKPVLPASGQPLTPIKLTPSRPDAVYFGKAEFDDKDLKEMGGERLPGVLQQIPRGALHFDTMAEAIEATSLSAAKKESLDAFGALIRIGLRDKKNISAKQNYDLKQQLLHPTDAMVYWMLQLGIEVEDLVKPVVDIDQIDREAYTPTEVFERMNKLGLFALKAPETLELKDGLSFAVGGVHLNNTEYHYLVSNHLARLNMGSLLVPVSANNSIGNNPLALYGSEAQQKKYFPKLAKSEYLAAFGLTEPGAGTDTKRVETRAQLSPDGKKWVINGSKLFITNTQRAGVLFLVAKTSKPHEKDQYTTFLVDLPFRLTDQPKDFKAKQKALMQPEGSGYHTGGQLHISDPLEMGVIRGSNQAYIALKDFEISVENVLGGSGKLAELPLDELQEATPDKPIDQIIKDTYFKAFARNYQGDGDVKKAFAETYLGQVGSGRKIPFDALALGRNGFGSAGYGAAMERLNQAAHRALEREAPNDFVPRVKNAEGKSVPLDREGQLGDLPDVQRMLSESMITAVGINAVTELSSALIDYHAPNNGWGNAELDLAAEAVAAKVFGADGAWNVGVDTQQIFGGQGLFQEGGYFRTFRDLWVNRIVEGVHAALEQWVTLKSLAPYVKIKERIEKASGWDKQIARKDAAIEVKNMKFSDLGDQGGGLPAKDVRWLRSRTRELNARSLYAGFKLGKKMQTAQLINMRVAKAGMGIFAITAASLKLEREGGLLPRSERLALEAFVERTKVEVDTALKGISPSALEKDLKDTAIARHLIAEVAEREPDGDPKTKTFWLKQIATGERTLFNEPRDK